MIKKRFLWLPLLCLMLTACGAPAASAEPVELRGFAAASMQESLDSVIALYRDAEPEVTVLPTYDSSGTLLRQIQEGAGCDVFISAAPQQMDALDREGALLEDTRLNLLENRVVLAVPEGDPKGIVSFDQLAELLARGDVLLAMGNSSVPAGQYTQRILTFYGLEETSLAASGVLTYGSNVKEVTVQVVEGAVDCGVIYATDAFSAGLTAVDTATAEMCGQVLYPAAVTAASPHPEEAQAFLRFLSTAEAAAAFVRVGFTPLT